MGQVRTRRLYYRTLLSMLRLIGWLLLMRGILAKSCGCCILKARLLLWLICLEPVMLVCDPIIDIEIGSEVCFSKLGSSNSSSSNDEMLSSDWEAWHLIGAEFIIYKSSLQSLASVVLKVTLDGLGAAFLTNCHFVGITLHSSSTSIISAIFLFLLFDSSEGSGTVWAITRFTESASQRNLVVSGIVLPYTSVIVCLNQSLNLGNRPRPSDSKSASWTSSKN